MQYLEIAVYILYILHENTNRVSINTRLLKCEGDKIMKNIILDGHTRTHTFTKTHTF